MRALSVDIKSLNIQPEQVQDFTPTPLTLSSVMFYSGLNPYTMKPIFIEKSKEAKIAQKEQFFWTGINKNIQNIIKGKNTAPQFRNDKRKGK